MCAHVSGGVGIFGRNMNNVTIFVSNFRMRTMGGRKWNISRKKTGALDTEEEDGPLFRRGETIKRYDIVCIVTFLG